jgi:hypothetical protein
VALDQNLSAPAPDRLKSTAIDNEIGVYRAIHPAAVFSLICGVFSLLSFVYGFFLLVAALAVVLGFHAQNRIKRFPDMWTGLKLAQAGTALGLIFGVASFTMAAVQEQMQTRAGLKFANEFVNVLKQGSFNSAIWWSTNPHGREKVTPDKLVDDMRAQTENVHAIEEHFAPIKNLVSRASTAGEELKVKGVESQGFEGLDPWVAVVLQVNGPGTAAYPEKEQFALAVVKWITVKNKVQWWVEPTKFPYEPKSYEHPTKPIDDGHNHGGGGHSHAH